MNEDKSDDLELYKRYTTFNLLEVRDLFKNDFYRALFVTLFLIIIFRLCSKISIPFINKQALSEYMKMASMFDPSGSSATFYSIVLLGIMPYVSAFLIVELLSLIVPPLKKLRTGNFDGRRKLKIFAVVLTMPVSIIQSISIVNALKAMELPNSTKILLLGNSHEYLLLIATMVGGVYFVYFLSELISKYGIGHGISLMFLSGIFVEFGGSIKWHLTKINEIGLNPYFLSLFSFFVLSALAFILLKTKVSVSCVHKSGNKSYGHFQMNLCPSSDMSIAFSSSILIIPAAIISFFNWNTGVFENFYHGSLFYEIMNAITIILLSFLFARLFLHPKKRIDKLRDRGWEFTTDPESTKKLLLRKMFMYNILWTGFLCMLAIVPSIVVSNVEVPIYIGGASSLLLVAVIIDIFDIYAFHRQRKGAPVKVAEIHDVYDATMIKNHLIAEGIPCHLRGYYHRHLLYFFGPYIEISLMVSSEDQAAAQDIIEKYHGGLGLITQPI